MWTIKSAALSIVQSITLKRKNRSRPSAKSIFENINKDIQSGSVDWLEISVFQDAFNYLESEGIIFNKKRDGNDSYYLSNKNVDDIFPPTSDIDSVIETDSLNFIDNKSEDCGGNTCSKKEINDIFEDVISRKISVLVKAELEKILGDADTFRTPNAASNNDDTLINTLKSDIIFLKEELLNKNKIIELLVEESCNRQHDINKKPSTSQTICANEWTQIPKRQRKNISNNTASWNTDVMNLANRYSILSPSDNEIDTSSSANGILHNSSHIKRNSTVSNRRIAIVGDSLLKHVDQYKMRNSTPQNKNIWVKSFGGADVDDMEHHIIPTLKRSPSLLVIHCGTNSLQSKKSADQIAHDILKLASRAKTNENEVIVSSLIARRDALNHKGTEVNKCLKLKCDQHNFEFLDNSNISNRHLNSSGIHLNALGTYQLARNFLDIIKI